jgi:hypothetical protein
MNPKSRPELILEHHGERRHVSMYRHGIEAFLIDQ